MLETAIFCLKFTGFIASCCSIFSSTAIYLFYRLQWQTSSRVHLPVSLSLFLTRVLPLDFLFLCWAVNKLCSIGAPTQGAYTLATTATHELQPCEGARSWGMLRRGGEEELPSVSDVVKVVAMGVYMSCVWAHCVALPWGAMRLSSAPQVLYGNAEWL